MTTYNPFSFEALFATHDPSPFEMDAETFYHLGKHAVDVEAIVEEVSRVGVRCLAQAG